MSDRKSSLKVLRVLVKGPYESMWINKINGTPGCDMKIKAINVRDHDVVIKFTDDLIKSDKVVTPKLSDGIELLFQVKPKNGAEVSMPVIDLSQKKY